MGNERVAIPEGKLQRHFELLDPAEGGACLINTRDDALVNASQIEVARAAAELGIEGGASGLLELKERIGLVDLLDEGLGADRADRRQPAPKIVNYRAAATSLGQDG